MKSIKKNLKEAGINPSYQRIVIYKYLMENQYHPSIEQIYNGLKDNNPTLSKTTVYNTLKLFLDHNLVKKIICDEAEMRYDINTHDHMHFKCKKCGEIYDIDKNNNIYTNDFIDGHKINERYISLKGICKSCLEKE
ncbi:MAG TPA: transcriptional repressor [Candidatus Mcinerneyibacterium sp.]|nr:transcriptional repressor [Candidatus Mcinerneyibacterium sp.]